MRKLNSIKKFFLFTLIIVSLYSCEKEKIDMVATQETEPDVSIDLATSIAKKFAYDNFNILKPNDILKTHNIISNKNIKKVTTIESDYSNPALYAIQFEPEGFIIISATKKETPILAFSQNGFFDYDPLNNDKKGINEWVKSWIEIIKYLKQDELYEVPDSITEQWDGSRPPEDEEIIISGGSVFSQNGPLLNTIWGQGCGYNDLLEDCSIGGECGKVYTGCVATATAQIMRYWEYPETYSWNYMPNSTGSTETSTLMRDIGLAVVDMEYNCWGSFASVSDAKDALVDTFGYSSNAAYYLYNFNTVKDQISSGWPVILRGEGSNGGHAWVCDGYGRNKFIQIHNPGTYYEYETYTYSPYYIHMNWGYDGDYNGFYIYSSFTLGSTSYNTGKSMLINIHP